MLFQVMLDKFIILLLILGVVRIPTRINKVQLSSTGLHHSLRVDFMKTRSIRLLQFLQPWLRLSFNIRKVAFKFRFLRITFQFLLLLFRVLFDVSRSIRLVRYPFRNSTDKLRMYLSLTKDSQVVTM